jgi:cytochrome c oxidase subunit II
MLQDLPMAPPSASTFAPQVDGLYLFLVLLSGVIVVGTFAAAIYFSIRYRRRPGVAAAHIEGVARLEFLWSFIPLVLALGIFAWGAKVWFYYAKPPPDVLDFYVSGKQWMWKIQHPTGQREINEMHVPVDRAVRCTMTSEDVIHSYFIPAFRLKRDVVPGRYTELWFQATREGVYDLYCAEYCGTLHSGMIGKVHVLSQRDYERWLATSAGDPLEAVGARLFENLRCNTCHAAGAGQRGPVLDGIFGTRVALESGGDVRVDEGYVRESILHPLAKVTKGFEPLMPTYEGQVGEEEIMQLVAYIKSLRAPQGGGKP